MRVSLPTLVILVILELDTFPGFCPILAFTALDSARAEAFNWAFDGNKAAEGSNRSCVQFSTGLVLS